MSKKRTGKARRRSLKQRQARRRRKHSFETLEPRHLLSVTPSLTGGAATFQGDTADDGLILRVNAANQLEFSDGLSGSSFSIDLDPTTSGEQSLTLGAGSSVAINLDAGNDTLRLDATLTSLLATNALILTFDGGTGIDTLQGANVVSTWELTGEDAGTYGVGSPSLNVATFADVESLIGGSDDDLFRVVDAGVISDDGSDGGDLTGTLDGGAGTDTLDYSGFDHEISVSLGASDGSNIADFTNLESYVGGNYQYFTPGLTSTATAAVETGQRVQVGAEIYEYIAVETLASRSLAPLTTINPDGINYLDTSAWQLTTKNSFLGTESTNAWIVSGADSGTLNATTSFSNFQDLVGGRHADTFAFTSAGSLAGELDGGDTGFFDFTQQSEPVEVLVGERVVVVASGVNTIYERVNSSLTAATGQTLDLTTENFSGADWSVVVVAPDHVDLSALTGGTVFDLSSSRVTVNSAIVVESFRQIGKFTANSASGDSVRGPATQTTWEITGADTVEVNGTEFVDVESLIGSDSANDQFVFSGSTSVISTLIDGGTGGRDSFAFRNGNSLEVVRISGSSADQSGTAPHKINPSNSILYANIDPISLALDAIVGTSGDDNITLNIANGDLQVTYAGVNFGETISFVPLSNGVYGSAISSLSIPLSGALDIKIDLMGGSDRLTIDTDLLLPGKNLEILAEIITVAANRTIDTRSSTADSGSILFSGESIVLGSGAKLLAQASSGQKAGDITLEVVKSDFAAIQNAAVFALNSKEVQIDVQSDVEIRGDNITFFASARDKSNKSLVSSLFQGKELESSSLVNDFSIPNIPGVGKLAGVPVKVILRKSQAQINVGAGVTIAGAGYVDIRTRATSDSSGEVESKLFSVGYVQAEAISKITFVGDTTNPTNITSGQSTVIRTDGKVKAKLKTKTAKNLGDAGATKLALSVAVSRSDLISQIDVPAGVNIVSQKTANIKAAGEAETNAEAKAGLHSNGVAGLAFAIDISNADIKSEVNGNVTANQESGSVVKFEFDPTRTGVIDNNRINLAIALNNTQAQGDTTTLPHDLPSGSPIEYSNRRGNSIGGLSEQFIGKDGQILGGLVDGETYYIVRDPTDVDFIYLSESASKARKAEAKLAAGQSLSFVPFFGDVVTLPVSQEVALNTKTFDLDAVNADTDEITLPNPGFTGQFGTGGFSLFGNTFELGQAVIYKVPTGGTAIGGLTDNTIYYVNVPVTEAGINGDDRFVDKQVIKLSETENKANAGVTLNLDLASATGTGHTLSATHVLDSGLATGIGVLAELDAVNDVSSDAGLKSGKFDANPKKKKNPIAKAKRLVNKFDFADKIYGKLTGNVTADSKYQKVQKQLGSKPKFSLAGAFSFSFLDHKALALVGDLGTGSFDTAFDTIEDASTLSTAQLKSKEDLEVVASISQTYQQKAGANNQPQDPKAIKNTVYTAGGQQKSTAAAGAIAVGVYKNQAKAIVQSGAQLDGYRATRVVTDLRYPYRTRPDEFIPGNYGELVDKLKSDGNPIKTVKDYIKGDALVDVLNSYTRAFAKADAGSNALAGSVNFVSLNDVAKSVVKSDAMINQDTAFRATDSNETFSVQAFNYKQQVHVTGVFDLPKVGKLLTGKKSVFGSKDQAGGFGGAIFVNLMNDTTLALVEQGTEIYTGYLGGLDVVAEEAIMNFSLTQSGSEAQGFGLSGTAGVVVQNSDTRAEVQGGVTIVGASNPTLDTDIAGSPITILANSLETNINWAGALTKTNSKSFGITVAVNDITRDTNAILGTTDVVNSQPRTNTNINTSGAITVKANNDGALWAFSAAAAIAGGSKSAAASGTTAPVGSKDGSKGRFGIGVSASVSWNTVNDTVNAYIHDAGTIQASAIDVIAKNITDLFSLSFAASLTLPSTSAMNSGKTTATIAGSLSKNTLNGKTRAYIKGRTGQSRLNLLSSGPVNVNAERAGSIKSISAGLGVEVSRNDTNELALAVAGSVSINEIDNQTEAFVVGIQDDTTVPSVAGTYQLLIDSTDTASIFAFAGGLSIALGGQNASAGLSLAWNEIGGHNLARLDDSKLSRVSSLDVLANGNSDIDAISVAGALAGGQGINIALAGTVSINTINVQTEALISGTDTAVAAQDNVRVLGTELSTIDADSGGFAIAASLGGKAGSTAISIGAAISINNIGQTRKLFFDATSTSVVSVAANTLQIPGHSMITGQKVTYSAGDETTNKAAIGGLAENKNYYVIVDSADQIRLAASEDNAQAGIAIDLTSLGGGNQHSFDQSLGAEQPFLLNSSDSNTVSVANDTITLPNNDMKTGQRFRYTAEAKNFDPSAINSAAVNVGSDTITLANHGWQNGDQLTYTTTGTVLGGLTSSSSYFVGNRTANSFQLYSDQATTQLVNITNAGVGTHQLQKGTETARTFVSGDATTIVSLADSSIRVANHGWQNGQVLTYSTNNTGSAIGGLVSGNDYYVVARTANTFQLATDVAGINVVTFSAAGSGVHQFQAPIAIGPAGNILRENTDYYVIRQSQDSFKLAISETDAKNGTAIDITATGGLSQDVITSFPELHSTRAIVDDAAVTSATGSIVVQARTFGGKTLRFDPNQQVVERIQFNPAAKTPDNVDVVDIATVEITLFDHGLTTGDAIDYSVGHGEVIGGLTDGATYFAEVIDADKIKIRATSGGSTTIDLTTAPQSPSPHLFESLAPTIDTVADTVFLSSHGLKTGDAVTYNNGTAVSTTGNIGGLNNNTEYFVIAVDQDHIRLATSDADATANTAVSLTSTGAQGRLHAFTLAAAASGIRSLTMGGSIAAGLGGGQSSFALSAAGAFSLNTIHRSVESLVRNSASLATPNNITVDAEDRSQIDADAGGIALGIAVGKSVGGALTIGASHSQNVIGNLVQSQIDNSVANSTGGSVIVSANSQADIDALTIAGSLSVAGGKLALSLSGAGAGSYNTIANGVVAQISGGSDVDGSTVNVLAEDKSDIDADAGALALAIAIGQGAIPISIGVSISEADIDNDVRAAIEGSSTNVKAATGAAIVSAMSDATIDTVTLAGALAIGGGNVAIGLAASGAFSFNTIETDVTAMVGTGATLAGLNVGATPGVQVVADDDSTVTSTTLGASLSAGVASGISGNIALAASVAWNTVDNDTQARVSGATIVSASASADVDVLIDSKSNPQITATSVAASLAAGVGAVGGSLAGAGADSRNVILGSTKAFIDSDSTLGSTIDDVSISATVPNTAIIKATVVSVAAGLGVGQGGGGAATIGVSLADNFIGWKDDTTQAANEVQAYINGSNISIDGNLKIDAQSNSKIDADVSTVSVALAGSAGASAAAAGSGARARNRISTSVNSYIASSNVTARGAAVQPIVITSNDKSVIDATVNTVSVAANVSAAGGSLSVAATESFNTISNNVSAYLDNANVQAPNGGIKLDAVEDTTITSNAFTAAIAAAVSIGGAGTGSGIRADNEITNTSSAYILGGNTTVRDDVELAAKDMSKIDAELPTLAISAGLGALAGAVTITENDVNPQVSSYLTGNVTSNTGDIRVTAESDATAVAETLTVAIAAGLISGAAAVVDASTTIGGTTEAYVGTGGNVTALNTDKGHVQLTANSRASGKTTVRAGAGSLLGTAVVTTASSINQNTTQAYVTGGVTARNLTAQAEVLSNTAQVDTIAGSGGFVAVTAPNSTVESNPKVNAFVGAGGNVNVVGDVNLQAIGRAEADGKSIASTGGVVAVNASTTTAKVQPTVDAYVSNGANVQAYNVNVLADLLKDGGQTAPSDFITAVDIATDTVDIAFPLQAGDTVEYSVTSGTPVGGLTPRLTSGDGRAYNVLDVSNGKVRFGNSLNAATDVDSSFDIITFSKAHNFVSGDKVVVDAVGGTSIFATASPTLFVRVLDDLRIRLVGTAAEATASETSLLAPVTAVDDATDVLSLPGNTLSNGDAVTYRSLNAPFSNESVDVNVVTSQVNNQTVFNIERDSNGVGLHTDNNNLFLPEHGFTTGDKVRYIGSGIGLVNDTNYFVIRINANEIQLAALRALAIAATPTPLPLTTPTNQTDRHTLARDLTGLRNDQTYYVVGSTANSIQLATSPGGNAINTAFIANQHGPLASHKIGKLGLDLNAGANIQTLRIDLTSAPLATVHQLVAEGGLSLAATTTLSGDGKSSVTAEGGTGGIVSNGSPTASLTLLPTVKAHIDGTVTTVQDVSILANSASDGSAYANATSGGLFDAGNATATVNFSGGITEASVGSTGLVHAGDDFAAIAETDNSGASSAVSRGGGAISTKRSTATTSIIDRSQAVIHDGGQVVVEDLATLRSGALANKRLSATANASSKAAGGGAISHSTTDASIDSENLVRVGKAASLLAGHIELNAVGQTSHANSDSRSDAFGLYAEANPTARRTTNVRPKIEIDGNATAKKDNEKTWVRGDRGIDMETTPAVVSGDFFRRSTGTLIINKGGGNQGAAPTQIVDAKQGAVIVAGPRALGGSSTPLFASSGMTHLGLYVDNTGTTTWDAEVVSLLAQPNAELTISPQGTTTGLLGEYFSDNNLTTLVGTRLDSTVDFNWGSGAPSIAGVGNDNFSVRWTGTVQPTTTGQYVFRTASDDGVRLWVDGQLLFDKFVGSTDTLTSDSIALNANQSYDIRLEYLELGGGAHVNLQWQRDGGAFEVIPTANLAKPGDSGTLNIDYVYDVITNTVTVNRIARPGLDVAQVLFAGSGTLTKSSGVTPQFKYQQAYDQVKIDIQSDASLVLNNISTGNSGLFNDGTVAKRPGDDVRIAGPNAGSFQFDLVAEFQPPKSDKDGTHKTTLFDVKTNNTITINGPIDNPLGTTSIVASTGDIVLGNNRLIRTNELTVIATAGHVGTATNRLNVELVVSHDECSVTELTPTKMTVEAGRNIYTDIRGLLRATLATPITTLDINIDKIDAGGLADVRLLEGLVQTTNPTSTSTPPEPNFDFTVTTGGTTTTGIKNHYTPDDTTKKNYPIGVFGTGTGTIETTYDFGLIEAGGGLQPVQGDIDVVAVFGPTATIVPINIQGNTNTVPTAGQAEGNIDVSSNGDVTLTETAGDMRIGLITSPGLLHNGSQKGNISLTSATGSILDVTANGDATTGDAAADVIGVNISLTANSGGVGSAANPLDIDSANPVTGTLTTSASNDIFLIETTGDLNINSVTSNQGNAQLVSTDGSILDANNNATANIVANQIDLTATNSGKTIGTGANSLELDARNAGWLKASASGDVIVTDTAGNLNVNQVQSQTGNAVIGANGGSIFDHASDTVNDVIANSITFSAPVGGVGTSANSLKIKTAAASTQTLTATARDSIFLVEADGDLHVNRVESTSQDVSLTSPAAILDPNNDANTNVLGRSITLTAGTTHRIGAAANPLEIDVQTGSLTATAGNDIVITDTAGTFNIDLVASQAGNATLVAVAGDMLEGGNDAAADITANFITLTSAQGSIGSASNAIEINTPFAAAGALTANAQGIINLTETVGDLLPIVVNSTAGDVILTSNAGWILDFDPAHRISGDSITLNAPTGGIGVSNNPIEVDTRTGSLSGTAQYDIFVSEVSGDLRVDQLTATAGNVILDTPLRILEGGNDTTADISGFSITLNAGSDICRDPGANTLTCNETLGIEQSIASANGLFTLLMQGDGNLVVYGPVVNSNNVYWASATNGTGANRTVLSPDGNLQLLDTAGTVIWESGSGAATTVGSQLRLEDNGQMAVYRYDGQRVWESALGNTLGGGTTLTPAAPTDGFIGSATNALEINLGSGSLNASVGTTITPNSGQSVYLTETSGDFRVTNIWATGNQVMLTANAGSILDIADSEVRADIITLSAPAGGIGTSANVFHIDGGILTATGQDDIVITAVSGDLRLTTVESTAGDVTLVSRLGSILDENNDTAADVLGNFILLDASAAGAIGSSANHLDIDTRGAGTTLTANARNGIFITETVGPLDASTVRSSTGNVTLITTAGSITFGEVVGNSIVLTANGSGSTIAGNVDTSSAPDQTLTATAAGDITITELIGDLDIFQVGSTSGNVTLTVPTGGIYDANPNVVVDTPFEVPVVLGASINLNVPTGAIGLQSNPLDIDSSDAGSLNASASGDIFITDTAGNLNIANVASTAGNVRIVSNSGSIFESGDDLSADISARSIDLVARNSTTGSIGAKGEQLEIDTSSPGRLFADSRIGVYVTEVSGALDVLVARAVGAEANFRIFDGAADVDAATDQISVPAHGFAQTTERVHYSESLSGGTNVGPLVHGGLYYVIIVDANTVKLASTKADALAGTAIDLTDGTGQSHALSEALGSVEITVRDSGAINTENLNLLQSGTDLSPGMNLHSSLIGGQASVFLSAGDEINAPVGTLIRGVSSPTIPGIVIHADSLPNAAGESVGARVFIHSELEDFGTFGASPRIEIFSGNRNDLITVAASRTSEIFINGTDPNFPGEIGTNSLRVDGNGDTLNNTLTIPNGSYDFANLKDVHYENIDQFFPFAGNDTPVNVLPSSWLTTPVNTPLNFNLLDPGFHDFGVIDLDATSITVMLSLGSNANGTLSLDTESFPGVTVTGNNTDTLQVVGSTDGLFFELGKLIYTPNTAFAGVETLTMTSSDGASTDTDSFTIVVGDTAAPTANLIDPTSGSTITAATLNDRDYLEVNFADNFGLDFASITGDELRLSGPGAGTVRLSGVPQQQGTTSTYRFPFTGDFVPGLVSVHFLPNTFLDLGGTGNAIALETFTVSGAATPSITSTALANATVGQTYTYDVNASDADAGDTLTYSLDPSATPTGMTIHPDTGLIQWTPTAAQLGANNVTVRVTDSHGLSATQAINVTVGPANRQPLLSLVRNQLATQGQLYTYTPVASDPDGPFAYALIDAPAGMTINPITGEIQWTPSAAQQPLENAVTVQVTDPLGQFASDRINYTVAPAPTAAGDFDTDGDVDGFDFLSWQRGFGTLYDSSDLTAWQTNYGQSSSVAALASFSTPLPALEEAEPLIAANRAEVIDATIPSDVVPQLAQSQPSRELVNAVATATPTVLASSPAPSRSELVDLALAFALQDQTELVRQAKTSGVLSEAAAPLVEELFFEPLEAEAFATRDVVPTSPAGPYENAFADLSEVEEESEEEANEKERWLSEDLLERVFG